MSNAFEITTEDVRFVLKNDLNIFINDDTAELIMENLDFSKIEKSALWGDSMEEQTNFALIEIKSQVINNKEIKKLIPSS